MSEAPSNVLDFNTALTRAQLEAQARTRAVEHEVRLERLRQALQDSARELVRDIFPRARIHAGEARIGSTACHRSLRSRLGRSRVSRSPPPTTATGLSRRCPTSPTAAAIHTARSCLVSAVEETAIDAEVSTTR